MTTCTGCAVRENAICQSLGDTELLEFEQMGRRRTLRRGETIAWQGHESEVVGNVIEGVLKLSSSTAEGREQTLSIMLPSDFLGDPFGRTSQHSVVALTDARICTFRRAAFDDFARSHPDLEHGLLRRTFGELDRTRAWMLLLGQKTAQQRIAAFLLEMIARLAGTAPDDASITLELPMSRQDIADLLGLTIETVSRQLTKLRDQGIIDTPTRRRIVVHDAARLRACSDE